MEKNNKKQYLSEDQDLIKELAEVGAARDTFAAREREVQEIQIKATLRSRESMEKLDKSTTYYSKVLGLFALIQIVISIIWFTYDVVGVENKWVGFFLLIALVAMLIWIMKVAGRDLKNK